MTSDFGNPVPSSNAVPGLSTDEEKRFYEKPQLVRHGSVRNMTGGSTFFNIDGFCGSSGNGFEGCFM